MQSLSGSPLEISSAGGVAAARATQRASWARRRTRFRRAPAAPAEPRTADGAPGTAPDRARRARRERCDRGDAPPDVAAALRASAPRAPGSSARPRANSWDPSSNRSGAPRRRRPLASGVRGAAEEARRSGRRGRGPKAMRGRSAEVRAETPARTRAAGREAEGVDGAEGAGSSGPPDPEPGDPSAAAPRCGGNPPVIPVFHVEHGTTGPAPGRSTWNSRPPEPARMFHVERGCQIDRADSRRTAGGNAVRMGGGDRARTETAARMGARRRPPRRLEGTWRRRRSGGSPPECGRRR